jgi:hypothetical protein
VGEAVDPEVTQTVVGVAGAAAGGVVEFAQDDAHDQPQPAALCGLCRTEVACIQERALDRRTDTGVD